MNILISDILAVLPGDIKVCSVYIKDGVIAGIDNAPEGFVPDKTVFGSGKLLIPGLVNAHTHAYMTVFRNCADDLLFNDWLFGRIMPMEDRLTQEDCYWGTMLGCMEMLATGTTSFLDMYIFTDAAAQAVEEAGMRAVMSRGLSGAPDEESGGNRRVREALAEIEKWKGHDRISFMLAPHAPYTCSEEYMTWIGQEAKRLGVGINIHLSESLTEIETIKNAYGCSPIEVADRCGLLSPTTVAAHCVQLDDSDIALMAMRRVNVATNPVSNLKLANGVAPVMKLLRAGINVALGTDGAASNNALNMFRDLSFLTLLHKGINGDAQAVSAYEGLEMATKNGAQALGLKNVGVIKVGCRADLTVIDLDRLNMQPVNNAVAALAYSANGSEVETVMVDGRILMEKGEFITVDREKVLYEVDKVCERIGTRK